MGKRRYDSQFDFDSWWGLDSRLHHTHAARQSWEHQSCTRRDEKAAARGSIPFGSITSQGSRIPTRRFHRQLPGPRLEAGDSSLPGESETKDEADGVCVRVRVSHSARRERGRRSEERPHSAVVCTGATGQPPTSLLSICPSTGDRSTGGSPSYWYCKTGQPHGQDPQLPSPHGPRAPFSRC